MTGGWAWVEAAAGMLPRDEREAVLGDLTEAGEGVWQAMLDVLGLVLRRQALHWKNWRPWVAAFGVALPCSFLLMGMSVSVSWAFQHILTSSVTRGSGLALSSTWTPLILQALLLIGWSWTGGFVVGSVSRRTLWVTAVSCFLPCIFCLSRFRVESLPRFCLFLFLLPAIWGVREALRMVRIKPAVAMLLAAAVTALAIPTLHGSGEPWWNPPRWMLTLTLTWPAWCLVGISSKTRRNSGVSDQERLTEGEGRL